ncbi:hypothetical protein O181_009971 [Austropuccinia psidii MF-1]|uniref:Uncharacterized protein n=1 Tax=Austropuccinia psidii MF-1 TaxID=1389203 RepID=A0A9Q3BSV7_9BASI|nr:hypothetical protein [Austropuccinia psidii MF-1]
MVILRPVDKYLKSNIADAVTSSIPLNSQPTQTTLANDPPPLKHTNLPNPQSPITNTSVSLPYYQESEGKIYSTKHVKQHKPDNGTPTEVPFTGDEITKRIYPPPILFPKEKAPQ